MKKKTGILFPVLSVSFLLGGIVSCGANESPSQTTGEIISIRIEGDKKTTYHYGESFVSPTIIATDDKGNTYDVTAYSSHTGFSSYKVGAQTVVITYYSFTVSYDIEVINEVCAIVVEGQKTSFEVGDEFSFGGGKVYKVYDNGDRVELGSNEYQVSGFSSESAVSLATVTITYGDFTITYSYSIKSIDFVAVSIAFSNVQENYDKGDIFVRPTAIVTDVNGETLDVSDSVTYSGFDSSVVGAQTITGSYKNVSNTFSITINEVEEGGTSGVDIPEDTISKAFSITNDSDSSTITPVDGVYLIDENQAKTNKGVIALTLKGKLTEGQIKVNAPDCEVELTLNGVSISNSTVSPIDVVTCDEIDISAKKNSTNYIYDNRPTSIVDEDNDQYGAAIYVEDGDLTLKGKGQLYLKSLNNNGVHGKDDVKIKNLGLVINAVNNGVKGNDSVTFEEAPAVKIECGNDGIKTSSTDLSSKEKQRGTVSILGGEIEIQSYGDGVDAAYDLIINSSVDEDDETITYTRII